VHEINQTHQSILHFKNLTTSSIIEVMLENKNQKGFIPMLIVFLLLIIAVIYLVFTQVASHNK